MKTSARRLAPSRRCIRWGLAALGLSLLVPLTGFATLLWLSALAALGALLVVDWFTGVAIEEVEVSREFPGLLHVGHDGECVTRIRNVGGRPLRIRVAERLPYGLGGNEADTVRTLQPGATIELRLPVVGMRRGRVALEALGVALRTELGLLEHRYFLDPEDSIRIAPGRPRGETAWLLARAAILEEHGQRPVRRIGAGWEFESLRDYAVGDEIRNIDWKASARRHVPMVRQFEIERHTELILALDCGRMMGSLVDGIRKLDLAMTPLLDVAAVALAQGEKVGLLCFDGKPRVWLPPRGGLGWLHRLTASLADLDDQDEPTSYLRAVTHLESRHRKRSYVIVFTDFTDEITGREMYATLGALAKRHRLVFVAVSDPHLERIVEFGPEGLESARDPDAALFEAGTAGQLLIERRRTLERIERMGVPTLDAEPRRLSGRLISRWLQIREEGLA